MKRRTTGLLAAALLAVLLLAGCGTRPLPSGMDRRARRLWRCWSHGTIKEWLMPSGRT